MVPDPIPHPESSPELSGEKIHEAHDAWCRAYVHVWADLSKGNYDKDAVQKMADEHWQRSPKSSPVMVATMDYTKRK
ncbi:hypothetical protein ACEN8I_21160 [Polaromonas sp. CT11-55]|uniref:hypothetical protein n=1 Tax=Polaromonas sp. CT11-55 TaxID=3243045 RepID=UPI0039A54791